ncbi:hypothetical protein D3Z60_02040 [Lachnospiraceae bacterium]|jgi:hypothetical protein|nr:hypothetical protein [Lachnospiraceae bacterium]
MIEVNYVKVKNFVYIYMLLPLLCFIALYLHSWLGGIFLVILFGLSVVNIRIKFKRIKKARRRKKVLRIHFEVPKSNYILQIPIRYLVIFAIVAVIWSFLGGQGNLYYQSPDWGCRNAIYRDIIYREWPVVYPDYNKALVYYIGYWLPAASVTKIIGFVVPSIYSTEVAFTIGNILLWIWTSIGIFFTELLLLTYAKPILHYRQLLVPIILVFFSGMDIIGAVRNIVVEGKQFWLLHLEWWCDDLQFSSLTTCLFWVFNQTIVPWLAILCVLQEEKLCNYVFIGICAFAAGPIPMVGIAVYMLLNGIYKGIDSIVNKKMVDFLKEVFTPVNCLAVLILPVFLLYYKSNQALNNGVAGATSGVFSVFKLTTITDGFIEDVLLLLVLEAGIYLLLLYRNYKNDIFYYITIITTFIAPFVKIGGASDFIMRFSIPTVMVMAAMCLKYLVNYDVNKGTDKISKYIVTILCVCLLIGAMTPMTEFFRGYSTMLQTGKIINVCDDIKTFNQDIPSNNFTANDYKNSAFFKVFISDE